jgi:hypothetical protein
MGTGGFPPALFPFLKTGGTGSLIVELTWKKEW